MSAPLVTVSASYGAGGSRVGPLLAEQLDVPFVERVMRRSVADRVVGPLSEARRERQPVGPTLGRILRQISGDRTTPSAATAQAEGIADEEYRRPHDQDCATSSMTAR